MQQKIGLDKNYANLEEEFLLSSQEVLILEQFLKNLETPILIFNNFDCF